MQIGPYRIQPGLVLAPMAGVTDKPFRQLAKRLGAGYAVSEMTTSDPRLWRTRKSVQRMDHDGEPDPIGVQIAGGVPLACDEGDDFSTFRIGLFGLDKLTDVDGTVARLEAALATFAKPRNVIAKQKNKIDLD